MDLLRHDASHGHIEGVFYLLFGYAALVAGLGVYLTLSFTSLTRVGFFWSLIPLTGGVGIRIILYRRKKHRGDHRKLFGHLSKQVGSLWSVVGPGIGLGAALSPNPLGVQLLLLGIGVAVHSGLMRFRLTQFLGIATAICSVWVYHLPKPINALVFGILCCICLCVSGHLLMAFPHCVYPDEEVR